MNNTAYSRASLFQLFFLILLLFPFGPQAHATCTPHTVSMSTGGSGQNANAFTSDGILGSDNGVTYFVHWDDTYLYLGWAGGTTTYSSDLYFAALNVFPGGSNGSILGASFSDAVMDYYVVYENNSSFYGDPATQGDGFEVYQANGPTSWSWVKRYDPANDGNNGRITFGAGSGAEARIRVPWSDFGGKPSSFSVTMWVNVPAGNNIYSSYPTDNPIGNNITLTHAAGFNSTGPGVCPAAAQNIMTLLPVELTHFSAEKTGETALLNWATASELNNAHFLVQRSADSKNWETIGTVQGQGTTLEPQTYRFTDREPLGGLNYYRLKQEDFDGASEFSSIVSIDFRKNGKPQLFPNPVRELLFVKLPDGTASNHTAHIFDVQGRLVFSEKWPIENGLDVQPLHNGLYLLRLEDETGRTVLSERFMKN